MPLSGSDPTWSVSTEIQAASQALRQVCPQSASLHSYENDAHKKNDSWVTLFLLFFFSQFRVSKWALRSWKIPTIGSFSRSMVGTCSFIDIT
jgi:hypothetical protein